MKETNQTPTQTVYEHGTSVWSYTKKLISGNTDGFKLPEWFIDNHRYIINNLHSTNVIKNYNIFHDCGKPYCLTLDGDGKQHFPNHAEVSKEVWNNISADTLVGDLIGYDMSLHSDNATTIKNYKWDKKTSFTLLVTALAELHSNASMFGGIESVSFKMKWKKWNQRGKMLLKMFPEEDKHPYSYMIVRKDLPNNQRAIQGTHAAIERIKHDSSLNYHPSVIYVLVKNEKKLKQVIETLLEEGIDLSIFREPMEPFNNSITAVCTEPLEGDKRNYLKKFMLMK